MLSLDGGTCTGATGRRQANHISLESWFHCFIVAHKWTQNKDYSIGGRKCYNTFPILLTCPCDNDLVSQQESRICKQGGHFNSGWYGVAPISVSGDAYGVWHLPHCWKQTTDKPVNTLKVIKDFLQAVCVIFFVPYSLCMPQYNNDMNNMDAWLSCLLPVAPVYIHHHVTTFISICHGHSNVYMQFPALPHSGKEK